MLAVDDEDGVHGRQSSELPTTWNMTSSSGGADPERDDYLLGLRHTGWWGLYCNGS